MDEIDLKEIKSRYDNMKCIWPQTDRWHYYTYQAIDSFIRKHVQKLTISKDISIVNLGSGGNPYCFNEDNMLHVDISEIRVKNKLHFLISNIEHVNVSDASFEVGLCVGSVINYADALLTIKELSRIVKKGGVLFLEFENSNSFEFAGTPTFHKKASIVTTFYQEREEKIWVYSEKYICNLLNMYNFRVIQKQRFHIFTPLIYRFTKDPQKAVKFYWIDKLFHWFPLSSNVILVARKL